LLSNFAGRGESGLAVEVDGEWLYAKDQPSVNDGYRIVNTLSLHLQEMDKVSSSPPGEYSSNIKRDITLFGTPPIKAPSTLPPHLNSEISDETLKNLFTPKELC